MKPTPPLQRAMAVWKDLPDVAYIAIAIAIVVALGLLLPKDASAAPDLVASNGQDSVRISDKPCSSEVVLAILNPKYRELVRDAWAVVGGQPFRACWLVDGSDAHLLYEDGDQGMVPLTDFKQDRGA